MLLWKPSKSPASQYNCRASGIWARTGYGSALSLTMFLSLDASDLLL